MKFYLVGGAVRDKLLGYPFSEKDWVVVGATPEDMKAKGFIPVGKDFPVFLHPDTKEEYALARTERKTGRGYTGFAFHASPDITLEQDLERRDLTINAIAETEEGEIVDPYGGARDIREKKLRHVSPAFAEDPVRVLRVARFTARYHHLGFTVAGETLELMKAMVANGELDYLVPERIWKELSRALLERSPDRFIEVLRQSDALKVVMPEIHNLFGVPQPPQHHPEVDTGLHCKLSLLRAAELSDKITVRFATLVHDLGKGTTPANMLPRHINHEKRSLPLIRNLCTRLAVPNDCRDLALMVAEFHTHCHRALELRPKTLLDTLEKLDAFRRPERFAEFLLCCKADARGRTGKETIPYPQADYFADVHRVCNEIVARPFLEKDLTGPAVGEAIRKARINAIKQFKATIPATIPETRAGE